jgi:hypothetical protein
VALVTPFAGDGGVDEGVLRELVRFHLREGTDALVVNGSTGEATTLSPDEQRRAVEIVVDEAGAKVPVIVGLRRERHGRRLAPGPPGARRGPTRCSSPPRRTTSRRSAGSSPTTTG